MPLSPIPSRVVEIAGDDGRSISVRRWDGDPDLVAMLLLPTREERTLGYDRFGSATGGAGRQRHDPDGHLGARRGCAQRHRGPVAGAAVRTPAPPVVLAGHGIGGLLAADYLVSERPAARSRGPHRARSSVPSAARRCSSACCHLAARPHHRRSRRRGHGWQPGCTGIRVRTRVEGGGQDEFATGRVWLELMRSLRPGDASIYPALGHDLPNEPGWRDRVQELVGWIQRAVARAVAGRASAGAGWGQLEADDAR